MKKLIVLLLIVIGYTWVNTGVVYAENASLKFSTEQENYVTEDTVVLNVEIDSELVVKEASAIILYDSEMLEFESSGSFIAMEKEGVLKLKDTLSDGGKIKNYEVKFKALKSGISKIICKDIPTIIAENGTKLSASFVKGYVEVGGASILDSDNTLKFLEVSPGKLNKKFKSKVASYKMTVPYTCEKLVINAVANSKKADIEISGNKDFKVGNNKVIIKVKAEDVSENEYIINVERISEEEQVKELRREYKELKQDKAGLYISDKKMYIMNDTEYQILNISDDDNMKMPSGYEKISVSLYGSEIDACVSKDNADSDVFLIYAKNVLSGDEGYYQYDKVEKTLQRYFGDLIVIGDEKTKKSIADNEYNDKIRILGIVIGMLSVFFVLSIVWVIKMKIEVRNIKNDNYLI